MIQGHDQFTDTHLKINTKWTFLGSICKALYVVKAKEEEPLSTRADCAIPPAGNSVEKWPAPIDGGEAAKSAPVEDISGVQNCCTPSAIALFTPAWGLDALSMQGVPPLDECRKARDRSGIGHLFRIGPSRWHRRSRYDPGRQKPHPRHIPSVAHIGPVLRGLDRFYACLSSVDRSNLEGCGSQVDGFD